MSDIDEPVAGDDCDGPRGSRRSFLAGAAAVGVAASLSASRAAAQGLSSRGARKSIVLVGGLACTPDLWTDQVAGLKDVADVIVTEESSRHPTMRGIAQAILKRAPSEFALVGLSMGGYIALEIMRLAPKRVTHLALLDTSARPDTDATRNFRGVLMDLARDEGMRAVLMRLMPNAIHPDRLGDKALVNRIVQMAWDLGTDTFYVQQAAIMGRLDSRETLKDITCPTLVGCGDVDKITPPDLSREMTAGIRGAKLMLFKDCGHFSSMERPELVNAALRELLAG